MGGIWDCVFLRPRTSRKRTVWILTDARRDRLQDLVAAAELSSKSLERQLRVETNVADEANARCEGSERDSLQLELEAKCVDLNTANGRSSAAKKDVARMGRQLRDEQKRANTAVARCESLEAELGSRQLELQAKCEEVHKGNERNSDLEKDIRRTRMEVQQKCAELEKLNVKFTSCTKGETTRQGTRKVRMAELKAECDTALNARTN